MPHDSHDHPPEPIRPPEGEGDRDEAREPITRLDDVRAPHNVVAAFDGLGSARRAIERLEGDGVEGSHISLLGAQRAEHTDEVAEESFDEPQGEVGTGAVAGGAAGIAIGGTTGLIVGLPGVGPLVAAGLWAIFGSGIGTILGGVSQISLSEAWEHTFEAVRQGNVAVGVHTDDPEEADLASEILRQEEPLSINRFDDR